jgi:hypothetical protein
MKKTFVISDTRNCLLTHRLDLKLILIEWKDYPLSLEAYKETFETALHYHEKFKGNIPNYMADVRNQPPVSVEARKWFTEDMLPRGVYAGIERSVFVLNANVFKRYYMNEIFNSVKQFGIPFKFFNTKDKALNWIEKVNEPAGNAFLGL